MGHARICRTKIVTFQRDPLKLSQCSTKVWVKVQNRRLGRKGGEGILFLKQGDQFSMLKIRPKCNPTPFLSKLMGYLHNPTDISENCVKRHQKVSYNKK
jgi:hypothetical protein